MDRLHFFRPHVENLGVSVVNSVMEVNHFVLMQKVTFIGTKDQNDV